MEDEQVRQALDRGCDRRTVADVLGVSRRTTFNKEKRARAYGFPLDAYYNRGGRPTGSGRATRSATATDTTAGESDDQQRLDAVAAHEQEDEQEPDPESRTDAGETPETPESAPDTQSATDTDAEAEAKVGHVEGDSLRPLHLLVVTYQTKRSDVRGIAQIMNHAVSYTLVSIGIVDLLASRWLGSWFAPYLLVWIAGWWFLRAATHRHMGSRPGDWGVAAGFTLIGVFHLAVAVS